MVQDNLNNPQKPVPAPVFKDDEEVSVEQFEEAARQKYKIPKNLLQAMLKQESGNGADLTSPTGVKGKYMVTQDVASQWGKANGIPDANRDNPYHQVAAGLWYLRKNFDETNDVPDTNARWLSAVGKYYGGPTAVKNGIADTVSRDGISVPAVHVTKVGENWKALGLDGDQEPVQLPNASPTPAIVPNSVPGDISQQTAPPAQVDYEQELKKALGVVDQEFPNVTPEKDSTTAAQEAYEKFVGSKMTGFDRDVADASILFAKEGAEVAKGFDPEQKVVETIDPSTFPVQIVSASKDPEKEFIYQYFNRLGLQPKQTDEFIQATGWHLFDPQSLHKNLENFRNGIQAALPLDVSAATAAQVDAYRTGGADAARQVTERLTGIKNRFDESKHALTKEDQEAYIPYAAKVGSLLGTIMGVPDSTSLNVARGMMAMKLGAYQTSKENIQFWNNITGGAAFPELAKKMGSGFRSNYALLNQINKSMTTGESFAEQGVATSGMLLRNVAAAAVIAAALPVAGAGAVAGVSVYNLADTFISNLHESPETMKNAMVTQAVLLGIPWATKLAGGILGKYIGKTALTAANVAEASKVMKPAPLFSTKELGVATAASGAYMGASTYAGGGSPQESYAEALLGLSLPVAMHLGAEAVNTVKGLKGTQAPPESQAQIDFNSLQPETQKQMIEMTASGLQHPLVSNLIETATAQRAAQLGIDSQAVKMAFEAQEALTEKRMALGGLPVPIDPVMRDQYRQVLEIHAGLWAEYSINGLGAIGVASMAGTDPVSIVPISKRSPMVSTTHHINDIIENEVGTSLYDPSYPSVSINVDNAQTIATKLLTNSDPSAQTFARELQKQVDHAKANGYDRVGIVNVEQPGSIAGDQAIHENVHNETSRGIEGNVRARAKEDATKAVSDLDLTEKITKDVGEQRAPGVQQSLARQIENVIPIASEKPATVNVSGEALPKNRAVKNLDVRKRVLSGILRDTGEASRLEQKLDDALKSDGYLQDPDTVGLEQVYEPIANLTDKNFLKRHGFTPKEAEALVIAELSAFNVSSEAALKLADHLPLHERKAFQDFLNNPLTNKYEIKATAKASEVPPSTPDNDLTPERGVSSEKPVQESITQPAEQRGSIEPETRTGTPTPREEGTPSAQLEEKRQGAASTGQERKLSESRNQESAINPLSKDEINKLAQLESERRLSEQRKVEEASKPPTPKVQEVSAVEKLANKIFERSETARQEPATLKKRLTTLVEVVENPKSPQTAKDSAARALFRYGVTRGELESLFKGPPQEVKAEPLPAPAPEIKTQPEAPKAQETVSLEGPQPKIPSNLTGELNSLREQFRKGELAPGSTVELSNGVQVKVPSEENRFSRIVSEALDKGESYGRTAQIVRKHWSSKGEGGDQAVSAVLDKFNLPGEPSTREAQDLAHRAVVKSFNNPKMSPETVGSLVQSEARAGKEVPEVGLNQIPASDLYRWAKTRGLEKAFPEDIMSIGGEVARARKGNTVSLYSRTPKDKAITHSNESLDGKKAIGRTADGRAIIPNPENKSGVSIVKDQSFRETPTWDTKVPLYSRYGNGVNPKQAFQDKIAALYTEKNFAHIPVSKKNEVRKAFSVAQAAWNRNDPKAFQEETFKAVYKLDEIIGETKNKAQKLAEVGVTSVRLNPLISLGARAADMTGTNINVQTQLAANPLKRFVGYIADTYIVPKAVSAKNKLEKKNTTLKESDPISKTIPKLHAEDWLKGTGVGAIEGVKDAAEILATGGSTFQLQTGMSYNFDRSQTGWVGTDKAINRVAGAVGNAPDAFARRIAFDVVVRQFAREHALQFPEAQRSQQFEKFYSNVPEEITGLAAALTEKYTYNNPNATAEMVHSYIDQFAADGSKAALHHAANLAYRYVRVPTNVASQTARLTGVTGPGLVAWDAYQLYRGLFKSYDTTTGKFGMTLGERRVAIEKLTESSMGAMLMAGVAAGVLSFGSNNSYLEGIKKNVAGSYDEQDQKAGKREEIRQLEPGAAKIPFTDRTVKPQVLGPFQRVAQFQKDMIKGTGYQGLSGDKLEEGNVGTFAESYGKAATNVLGEYPIVGDTYEGLKGIFDDKKPNYARKIAEALTIGGAKDFGAWKDPIRRVTREGSVLDNLKNNYGFGKDLPAKVDSAGEPIKKRSIGSLFTKEFPNSEGLDEIERLGLSLPRHTITEKGSKLSVEEQADKAAFLGKKLKEASDKVVASSEYKSIKDDQTKALILNDAIKQININPDLTVTEAYHNARINAEYYTRKNKLNESAAYKKLSASQQQKAEDYLKSQFHKYSMNSEKKAEGVDTVYDLYSGFQDFIKNDVSDPNDITFEEALQEAVNKAIEKPKLPYERPKK